MPSIYTEFSTLPTEILDFGVGGPDFVGVRTSFAGLAAPTRESLEARRLVFIAAQLEQYARTFPEVLVWKAPWLVFALLGVDIQADDEYTDGTLAYLITAQPITHYGFVLAPAVVTGIPRSVALQAHAGYQAGLRIGAW